MNLKGTVTGKQQLHGKLEIKHGVDGISPIVEVKPTNNGFEVVVTDRDGEKHFELSNATKSRISEVTLLASAWTGNNNLYSQVVNVEGATENSQVDLTPSAEQLAIFYQKDLSLVTENENGVVTVYAIGQKPQNDYTIQVTITEVNYE